MLTFFTIISSLLRVTLSSKWKMPRQVKRETMKEKKDLFILIYFMAFFLDFWTKDSELLVFTGSNKVIWLGPLPVTYNVLHTCISIYFNIYVLYERITGSSKFLYWNVALLKGKSRISIPGIKVIRQGKITFPYEFYILPGAHTTLFLDWKVFLQYHRWSQIARCTRSIMHT